MIYTDITEYAREQANVSSADYTDAKLLKYVNRRYHEIENSIKKFVAVDYFYDVYTTNLVANQNEYSFETSSATQPGITDVIRLEIKWATTDAYYTLLKPRAYDDLTTDEISSLQAKEDGYYQVKDSSVFIYPTPLNSVSNGLRMQSIINLIDLTVTSIETEIFPRHTELRQYHYIIAMGVIADIFGMKRLAQDKANAEIEYNNQLQKMLSELGNRVSQPIEGYNPSGYIYKL